MIAFHIRWMLSTALLGAPLLASAAQTAPHGRTHEVRMFGSPNGARFEPADVEIAPGDTVVFVLVSGGPHNVGFDSTGLSPSVTARLRAAIHDPMMPLAGPFLLKDGERYAVSFEGIPPGTYAFYCLPHLALKMRGTVVVR